MTWISLPCVFGIPWKNPAVSHIHNNEFSSQKVYLEQKKVTLSIMAPVRKSSRQHSRQPLKLTKKFRKAMIKFDITQPGADMKSKILLRSAIIMVFLSVSLISQETEVLNRARQLASSKEYASVVQLLNSHSDITLKSEKLLAVKTQALVKLDRFRDALKTAQKRVEVATRKSPWHCMAVVEIAIRLKDTDLAFLWFNRAVDRGFLNPGALEKETLSMLKKDNRYEKLMRKIKSNIGIGKPVKDFAFRLMDGRHYDITANRGKVILIDFWATWCPPCVKGIPFLKEMYSKYASHGFDIIAISLDSAQKAVTDYLKKEQIKWPVRFSGEGWMDKTARLFKVNLIPSYWLIDRNGILRDFGFRLRDKKILRASIEKLISK